MPENLDLGIGGGSGPSADGTSVVLGDSGKLKAVQSLKFGSPVDEDGTSEGAGNGAADDVPITVSDAPDGALLVTKIQFRAAQDTTYRVALETQDDRTVLWEANVASGGTDVDMNILPDQVLTEDCYLVIENGDVNLSPDSPSGLYVDFSSISNIPAGDFSATPILKYKEVDY